MNMMFIEDCCEILIRMTNSNYNNRKEGEYLLLWTNGIQDIFALYFDDELVLLAEDGGNFGSKERPIAYRVSGNVGLIIMLMF